MKVYLESHGYEQEKFLVQIDVVDGVAQYKQLADVIKGFNLLGKKVWEIKPFSSFYVDFDTKYYNSSRFNKEDIEELWNRLSDWLKCDKVGFFVKNNSLYTYIGKGNDTREIKLPDYMKDTSCIGEKKEHLSFYVVVSDIE